MIDALLTLTLIAAVLVPFALGALLVAGLIVHTAGRRWFGV